MYQKNEVFSGQNCLERFTTLERRKPERYKGIMNDDALQFSQDAYAKYMHGKPVLNVIVFGATVVGTRTQGLEMYYNDTVAEKLPDPPP